MAAQPASDTKSLGRDDCIIKELTLDWGRDSGVTALEALMERRGAFDYILLETTGLADPGNIAPLFWNDDALGSSIYLDGVVTLVDAKNILKSLDEAPKDNEGASNDAAAEQHGHLGPQLTTAHLQISHADIIVVNKGDLVSEAELEKVRQRIRGLNGMAKLVMTTHSQVQKLEGVLLDLHAYDNVTAEDLDFAAKGHSHLDPTITTITLRLPPLSSAKLAKLDAWLRSVCWESVLPGPQSREERTPSFEVHRIKGRIPLTDGRVMLLQGVREIYELTDAADRARQRKREQPKKDDDIGKIVVIGRLGASSPWQKNLDSSLSDG
ncbi:MAG: hypothetical protein M1828_006762 [Chrysothrix sp. TS-e1954]|nr:MAG: hypothetical protein M1828_006762 [Chrysothrix sp. TS-e1954]